MNEEQMIARQQELLNLAKNEQRDLTTEEQAEYDQLQRSLDDIQQRRNPQVPTAGQRAATETGAGSQTSGIPEGADPEAGRRSMEQERSRVVEIMNLCRSFGLNPDEYISGGQGIDQVRQAVLETLQRDRGPANARVTVDEGDKFRSAAADGLLMRAGIVPEKPAAGAEEMRGMSMRDMAMECMTREGKDARGLLRMSSDEMYSELSRQFYNPTAAFPAILDNAIEKAYKEGHRTAPVTFDKWTKKGSLKDFKTHDNYYLSGPAGEFLEVPEGGELKHDVFGDEKLPTRKLKTYGRQFTLTRQAFINDDIDLVTRIPSKYAASARKTINKQCYGILVRNEKIYDGTALFGKAHKNILAKGTGITQQAMQGMILALQNQTDQFGETCIIRPATIIVPSGYMFDMYTLFFSPTIHSEGNTQAVNPLYRYRDTIEVVEDPTINVMCGGFGNVMPWWLLGAREDTDFMEVDYLNGQETPTIRRAEVPGTLGFVWDIYLDWGISVMDYRGAIENPGVKVENPIELA